MIDVVLLGVEHGPHARSYAGALARSPAGRLVGIYDASPDLGSPVAAELGVPYYADADELIAATGPAAAIIGSATNRHRALVELAAMRGLHVLSEKPLATTIADAAAMIEVCHNHGVQLHTAFVSRFYPVLLQARDLVAGGEIGRLRAMIGGNRGRPPLPPRFPAWITDADAAGGGALIDHSVHVVDAMRFVSGLEVREVLAETGTLFTDLTVEDSALVSIVFGDDVPASVDPSWSATPTNLWDYDFYLRLLGTEGSLTITTAREALQVSGQHGTRTHTLAPFEPDIDQAMVEAFLQSVAEGRVLDPCATGEDGLRAVEVACAAYASVAAERFVATAGAVMAELAVLVGRALVDGAFTGAVTLTIADGLLVAVDPPRSEGVLDASTATVVPGLLDIHTHGGGGVQVIDGPAADLDRLAHFYAAHGVTGFLATIGGSRAHIMDGLVAVRSYLTGAPWTGARCLGVHLEGPFISPQALGAFRPESALAPDPDFFAEVLDAADGHLRLMTLAPELEGADAIIELALARGVACSIGHSVASLAQVDRAVTAGARSVTHLFNGMRPLHHREPGLVGAALTDPRLVCELIVDGIHVHPTVVALAAEAKSVGGIALISDSISAAGLPDGDYDIEEQHVTIFAGSARLADGTLAGSTLTLDRAVANFAAWTKLPLEEAVRSATEVPSRLLGLTATQGRIAVGRNADFTAFDAEHRLLWTMVRGVIYEAAAA